MIRLWRSEGALVNRAGRRVVPRLVALVATVYLALTLGLATGPTGVSSARPIAGPMAWLLSASTDLGPAHREDISLAASLHHSVRPDALIGWTRRHHLNVQWQPGADWAYIEGTPANLGSALERGGARLPQPKRPGVLRRGARTVDSQGDSTGDVSELGRILGYRMLHRATPPHLPLDVPRGGLTPPELLRTYDAEPLAAAGITGKGQTIVFFEIDGYQPVRSGPSGPTSRACAAIHPGGDRRPTRQSPAAKPRWILKSPTRSRRTPSWSSSTRSHSAARPITRRPGRCISSPIGNSRARCGAHRWASAATGWSPPPTWPRSSSPCRSPNRVARRRSCRAATPPDWNASRFNGDWSAPPGDSDRGLNAVGSVPAMTGVGGTTLTTDASGSWISEASWFDSPMSQGTGGGVSRLFARPPWQHSVSSAWDATHRLIPDVAAVADPFSGVSHLRER